MDVKFEQIAGPEMLEPRWRALEDAARAALSPAEGGWPGASVFRGWSWLGCCFAQRFTAPVLLSVRDGGQDQLLALLNRRHGRLYLHETGDALLDAPYIEHNGPLARAPGSQAALDAAMAALASRGPVVMSGIDDTTLAAANRAGRVVVRQSQLAPAIDLAGLQGPYLDSLSANTRGQIRRAMRAYGAPPVVEAAPDLATSENWFASLVALHQASWQVRGRPGAFSHAVTRDFHIAFLARAVPRGEAGILRVRAGSVLLGYLYMLFGGGMAHYYQSGFPPAADARHKPGLVCHAAAIEHLRAQGLARYDLMARADRYKTSLAPGGGARLHWITLYGAGSWRGRIAGLLASRAGPA